MHFASDNTGPVHPKVLEALAHANAGYAMPYGADALTERAREKVREAFEAPEAEVFFVTTGAAANNLILASWSRPWSAVFCGRYAHLVDGEGNAPEAFSGGAKLWLVGAEDDKFTAGELADAIARWDPRHLNHSEPGPVSVTQVTEWGTLYQAGEIRAIADVAQAAGLRLHMDGARFANAAVALGLSAAEMSWKAGVDGLSFGATKNGALGVEVAILFDPEAAWELQRRQKRAAHLLSKTRYLAAQVEALLEGGLWRELAGRANGAAARLAGGLGEIGEARFAFPPEANMVFVWLPRRVHRRLHEAGARYYIERGRLDGADPEEPLLARLVCDWSTPEENVTRFLEIAAG